MTKRIGEWTRQDAIQLLSSSPWVKTVVPTVLPGLSPYQRRESGDMNAQGGGRDGIGFDPSVIGSVPAMMTGINAPKKDAVVASKPPKLTVRWESALPIRSAEIKINEPGAPELENNEDYAIAVYDVSLAAAHVEMKGLSTMLKKFAALKVDGKREVKPSRVAVIELGDSMATIVYLFPRSARLSVEDTRIEFDAQIGRIVLAQYFYPAEMTFQGRLEL